MLSVLIAYENRRSEVSYLSTISSKLDLTFLLKLSSTENILDFLRKYKTLYFFVYQSLILRTVRIQKCLFIRITINISLLKYNLKYINLKKWIKGAPKVIGFQPQE